MTPLKATWQAGSGVAEIRCQFCQKPIVLRPLEDDTKVCACGRCIVEVTTGSVVISVVKLVKTAFNGGLFLGNPGHFEYVDLDVPMGPKTKVVAVWMDRD